MVRGVASVLEKHHRVQVLDEALEAAVRLSHRYIPARQLPDKAVSLLDTTCARVAISQHAVPAQLDDCRRTIESLQTELEIIGREEAVGMNVAERKTECDREAGGEPSSGAVELEARWKSERDLVDRILAIRATLRKGNEKVEGTGSALEHAAQAQKQAAAGVAVADPPASDAGRGSRAAAGRAWRTAGAAQRAAGRVAADPAERRRAGRRVGRAGLDRHPGRPHGQERDRDGAQAGRDAEPARHRPDATRSSMIARRIQTSRAKLDNPNKPIGVFMLCGPSGVGKTETALTLAEALYGGEQNVITINMSEFQEAHTVSTLKGSPPGYVGYGEGGVLTEAVRRRPYSVVLLDEVEKAHSDVHELFFQVFDKGWMEDGEGRDIDFKNTIILLTSNVGTDLIMSMMQGSGADADARGHRQRPARAAAEGVSGGAARPSGRDSVLSAERRHARQHRPAAA